jgi:hypothetical protein
MRDFFEQTNLSEDEIVLIKKKIKKINEHNFFSLFQDVIYYKPIRILTMPELECFFIEKQRFIYERKDDLPFLNLIEDSRDKKNESRIDRYITFNCKTELKNVQHHMLTTQEYPKQVLLSKMLDFKERLIQNIATVVYIKNSFIQYCDFEDNLNEFEKIKFSLNIIDKLNDFEIELFGFADEIDDKINSFSTAKAGNYLISAKDDTLKKLYNNLEKEDFIDIHKTSQEQFIEVLKSDWEEHKSIIHFKMDNKQLKYFIETFNENLSAKISFSAMMYAGNIVGKKGIPIKTGSIYSSNSYLPPKRHEEIKTIFSCLKEKD